MTDSMSSEAAELASAEGPFDLPCACPNRTASRKTRAQPEERLNDGLFRKLFRIPRLMCRRGEEIGTSSPCFAYAYCTAYTYRVDPPSRGSLALSLPVSRCPATRYWILESEAIVITKSYHPERRTSEKNGDCVAPAPISRSTV